jgi:RNA polymerase sigma-70 factor (ECF subfamily)
MSADEKSGTFSAAGGRFATTQWSIVLAARRQSLPEAQTALASLCKTYWYPLYAYVRRQGHQSAEAQDLTQGFFARLLEKQDLGDVDPERGKFRSFLLASIKHFLINEWDRARAAKRGGTQTILSFDFDSAENRYRLEPADNRTSDRFFEKQWALTLLDQIRDLLRDEFVQADKSDQFEHLHVYLTGERPDETYAEAAAKLGMSEDAMKMAVHRLRRQFQERLREEIARTVATPDEVDEEIRALFKALQR